MADRRCYFAVTELVIRTLAPCMIVLHPGNRNEGS